MKFFDSVRKIHQVKGKLIQEASTILSEQFNLGAFYYKKISNTGRLTVFESNLDLLDCIDSEEFILNYPVICHPKYHRNQIQLIRNSENTLLDPVKQTRNILTDFIPNPGNNFIFERVKASKIADRKWHCIDLILCHLRSTICRQLSRCSNMKLFSGFGITAKFLNSTSRKTKTYSSN